MRSGRFAICSGSRRFLNGTARSWCIRYLQWIKTLPEWDGKELVLGGGSQGDWQCYHAAAHVPGVTRINANGSWGCDWTGQNQFKRLRSTYRPGCWYPDMAYFDPVFAAKRITCPVNISFSGLGDYCSTPASLTLVYRNLKGPKKITYVQGSTHGWRPAGTQKFTVDGGFDAATQPPPRVVDSKLADGLFGSKDLVYWLDASRAGTLETDAAGKVTCWKSANGNGYAFRPTTGAACTNSLNGKSVVSFGSAGRASLAGERPVEQRTVFIVCRPRRVATSFMGVWGTKGKDAGKDAGLRTAQGSAAWENVRGGPDFNSDATLIVNGEERRGAVPFLQNDIQVLAIRHPEDIEMWGAKSMAVFTPSVGEYVAGRFFDGDVADTSRDDSSTATSPRSPRSAACSPWTNASPCPRASRRSGTPQAASPRSIRSTPCAPRSRAARRRWCCRSGSIW